MIAWSQKPRANEKQLGGRTKKERAKARKRGRIMNMNKEDTGQVNSREK